MLSMQISSTKIIATLDKGAIYNIGSQKEVEKKLVLLARSSKFEDAWLYDGKKLVDIGFRENAFLNDARGDFFISTHYNDIKKNAQGKEKVALYHMHQSNPDNATYLITPQDMEVAAKTKMRLELDGLAPKFEYKVACPDGMYSLAVDDALLKAYSLRKEDFADYVMIESTKKEFELINGRPDKGRFFKPAREMSKEDKDELRKIQLSALGSLGITITFEKHE